MKLYHRLGAVLVSALGIIFFVSIASAQPPVPHPLEGRDDCLACHQTGVGGTPLVAADHIGRTNETCGQCHLPLGVEPAAVPAIPHPLEGAESCLFCHETGLAGASKIPDDHAGRTDETCQQCHFATGAMPIEEATTSTALPLIPHPLEGQEACLTCHEAGAEGAPKIPGDHVERTDETCRQCHLVTGVTPISVPPIPHLVEEREACLACHAGWIGQAPLVPDDHGERPNEVCQSCHQPPVLVVATPTVSAPPLPTPIVHPVAPGENSCVDCHLTLGEQYTDIALQWDGSVHATFDVTCADCHGGDPGADDPTIAMSPEAGYIGVPDRTAIPVLCGSCHANSDEMLPYGLPVDQLSEYQQSVHGQLLAQGDENVATCFDCHGGHATKAVDDPKSSVYPTKLPVTCAECHSDEERMERYGIATNQFELYQQGVHGLALMIDGNMEAPSCTNCHSSHGAVLPGRSQVIDVCGDCHAAAERYYLTAGHRRGRQKDSEAPNCVTCHGRYDVASGNLDLFVGDEPRHCGSCHASDSVERVAIDAMYQTLVRAEQAFKAAETAVYEAQTKQLSVDTLELKLEEARAKLDEAAAVQHELQLETIEEKTAEVESISSEIQEAIRKGTTKSGMEDWLPPGIIASVIGLAGLIANLVRRRAETR